MRWTSLERQDAMRDSLSPYVGSPIPLGKEVLPFVACNLRGVDTSMASQEAHLTLLKTWNMQWLGISCCKHEHEHAIIRKSHDITCHGGKCRDLVPFAMAKRYQNISVGSMYRGKYYSCKPLSNAHLSSRIINGLFVLLIVHVVNTSFRV